jgi:TIR domain
MQAKPKSPKVFLSHASEDKEFVLDFASRLRQRGIDVWLDRWEILPGDSFVDKIFDEGIAHAKAVIVIISRHSATKPWVREELNVAVVRKINAASKLIPVVIDDCQVPSCLQATLWEKIDDLKNYEPNLDRIVLSIFGESDKPPVGREPPFARKAILTIGDLTRVDSLTLQTACEICLKEGHELRFLGGDLPPRSKKLGISEEATWESIRILRNRGYLEEERSSNDEFPREIKITSSGFEEYLKVHWPNYESLLKKFASNVINKGLWDSDAIGKSLKVPYVLLDHIFDVFKDRRWIIAQRYGNGRWEIVEGEFSPEMKRWLES